MFHEGLQEKGTRNKATLHVAYYLYTQNYSPRVASELMRDWIRARHNGYSEEVNKGNWKLVDREIENGVNWVWNRYTKLSSSYFFQGLGGTVKKL